MSGRSHDRGILPPPMHEAHSYASASRSHLVPPLSHPGLIDDRREPPSSFYRGGHLPSHPSVIEERLTEQHHEIQTLLVDNQRLAATHVALKQELEAAQTELQRMARSAGTLRAEKEIQLRELYERSAKLDADRRGIEPVKAELAHLHSNVQKLKASKQEMTAQVQALKQELTRAMAELQHGPMIKRDIDHMKQELQRARAAVEFEKKAHTENYEQGQAMEKNLVTMVRETERLRAQLANAEKRAQAQAVAAASVNQAYATNYAHPDPAAIYGANPYSAGYAVNQAPIIVPVAPAYGTAPAVQIAPAYGTTQIVQGAAPYGAAPTSWVPYDLQHYHGQR